MHLSHAAVLETYVSPERPEIWKMTGPAALSTRLIRAAKKIQDEFPLEVRYSLRIGRNDFVFIERELPLPGKPKRLKVTLYADKSGNSVRMNFKDAKGEFFQAFVTKLDWEGWREIEKDLIITGHWGGDNNGKMDGEISFHSWVLNSEVEQKKAKGIVGIGNAVIYSEVSEERTSLFQGRASRVTLDDFERPNPLTVYQTWRGDDSTIELVSSNEFKKVGNYSMQVTYKLSTGRSVPSWVSLSFTPERPLDWGNVEELKFWIKGDSSRNILQISLVDENKRIWVRKFEGVLKKVDWQHLSASLGSFTDASGTERMTPGIITKYEISIIGEEAQLSSGRIWIDELSLHGLDLETIKVSPRPPTAPEVIEKTKINFGDFLHLEFRNTPENNSQFLFFNSLYIRGTSKKLSLAADLVSEQNEAGTSVGFRTPLEQSAGQKASPTEVVENRNPIELAFITASLHDLHPNLSQLTVGNISVDYGRDIFSPVFGLKGIEAEGNFEPLHYDTFAIKHAFDSMTFGFRLQTSLFDTLTKFAMVRYRDTAKAVSSAQIEDGQLVVPSDSEVKTEPIGNDTVYFMEIDRNLSPSINLSANYAMDFFDREATKDVTDPFNPEFERKLDDPVSLFGRMWQVKLKFLPGFFNKGLTFIASYRDLSREFKPRFRFDPEFYDDFFADQRGMKFELTQIYGKFKINAQYDDVDRGAQSSGYFRRFFQSSLGYYGWNKLDIVFSFNKRREHYALGENHLRSAFFITPLDPRNEEAETYELFLGNWFTSSFYIWTKLRYEDIDLLNSSRRVRNDAIQVQGEYAVTNNAKVILSVIQTRYDDKNAEPFGGDPPTDNVVRLFLDVNF